MTASIIPVGFTEDWSEVHFKVMTAEGETSWLVPVSQLSSIMVMFAQAATNAHIRDEENNPQAFIPVQNWKLANGTGVVHLLLEGVANANIAFSLPKTNALLLAEALREAANQKPDKNGNLQ